MFGAMGYPYSYFDPQTGQLMAPGMQVPQQQRNVMQAPQNAPQSGPDWVMAPTVKQVEQVSVQPGQKAWIMVQNEPVFALRTADNMGLVTTDYYRFEKYDPASVPVESPIAYVTAEQLEARLTAFAESLKPASKSKKGDAAE